MLPATRLTPAALRWGLIFLRLARSKDKEQAASFFEKLENS
jgi:hypothetical protein